MTQDDLIQEAQKHYNFIHPTTFRITQSFGENNVCVKDGSYRSKVGGKCPDGYQDFYKSIGMDGHNGYDYATPTGTEPFAVEDLTATNFYVGTGGYGVAAWFRTTKTFTFEGETYAIEVNYGHLKDYTLKIGQAFKKGQILPLRTNNTGSSSGAHLHHAPRLNKQVNGGWLAQFKDNGYFGYFDSKLLMKDENSMKTIKLANSEHIFLVSADNKSKIKMSDVWSYYPLVQIAVDVSQEEFDRLETNGSFVWVDRIID